MYQILLYASTDILLFYKFKSKFKKIDFENQVHGRSIVNMHMYENGTSLSNCLFHFLPSVHTKPTPHVLSLTADITVSVPIEVQGFHEINKDLFRFDHTLYDSRRLCNVNWYPCSDCSVLCTNLISLLRLFCTLHELDILVKTLLYFARTTSNICW